MASLKKSGNGLPEDVMYKVFKYFDIRHLCLCSRVCKYWHALLYSDSFWYPLYLEHFPITKELALASNHGASSAWRAHFLRAYIENENKQNKRQKTPRGHRGANEIKKSNEIRVVRRAKRLRKDKSSKPRGRLRRGTQDSTNSSDGDVDMVRSGSDKSITSGSESPRFGFKHAEISPPPPGSMTGSRKNRYGNRERSLTVAGLSTSPRYSGALSPRYTGIRKDMNYVYEIENFTEIRDDVLAWVRHQLRSYSHVKITGLNSFSNGVPFLALLHAVDHKLVDLDQFEMTDKKRLLATVFQLAEKYLDIPPLLSPDAIVEGETPEALLLYLYIFKIKIEVLSMKKNPIGTIQNEVSRLRHLVKNELSVLDGVKVDFDETVLRISDLTDDQQNQRMEFYKQRSERTEEAIKEALEVNKVLYRQNELLKEKNDKLHERVKTLEKLAEYEAEERRRLQEQFTLQEKLRAIEELLSEEDIEQYIEEAKKGNVEPIGSNSKIEELNEILGNKPKSKAQQMMRMKNLSSGKDKPKQIQRTTAAAGGLHSLSTHSSHSTPSEASNTSSTASLPPQAGSDSQVSVAAPLGHAQPLSERTKSVTFSANGSAPPVVKPEPIKVVKAKEEVPAVSPRRHMSPRGRRNKLVNKNSQELDP